MNKTRIIILVLFLINLSLRAQNCGTCTISITSTDSSSYVVTSGQTFCVDSSGRFTGTLTLSGGTICNKGVFAPKSFSLTSGSVSNYGYLVLNTAISVVSGGSITNNKKSVMKMTGTILVSGGQLINRGVINNKGNLSYVSGTLENYGIINCESLSGTGYLNKGIINKN